MSAAELINEAYHQGITLHLVGDDIKCRSERPIPAELIPRLKRHKVEIIQILKGRKKAEPYLSETGEFRCRGQWEGDILDALLSVGASDQEIKRHLDPIGTQYQWERWQKIKSTIH